MAVPDTTSYPGSDYYEIELGQYTEKMHSDLPPTTLRGYRQTNMGGTPFHFLGPAIVAARDRPVRIKFTNSLPTDAGGDLFLPVDTTIMGSGEAEHAHPYDPLPTTGGTVLDDGRNPMCNEKSEIEEGCLRSRGEERDRPERLIVADHSTHGATV